MANKFKVRVKKAATKKRVAKKASAVATYPTFEDAIDYLRRFFSVKRPRNTFNDSETQKLWDVLTALRGPDAADSYIVKDATTAVIRLKVFGNGSQVSEFADVIEDSSTRAERRRLEISDGGHFGRHVSAAFEARGLSWTGVNE